MIEINPPNTPSGTAVGVEIRNPEAPEKAAVIIVISNSRKRSFGLR
jgi:hypothetical protein